MKARNQSHALLVELLIVVLFFVLAATVLLQVFAAASSQSRRAGAINEALMTAQNTADRLCAAEPDEEGAAEALRAMGFAPDGASVWARDGEGYSLRVTLDTENQAAGRIFSAAVTAYEGEDALFTLPAAWYEEMQP